jgi:hypothetical protein
MLLSMLYYAAVNNWNRAIAVAAIVYSCGSIYAFSGAYRQCILLDVWIHK